MMKPVPRHWFVILITFVFFLCVLFQIYKSDLTGKNPRITHQVNNFFISIASSSHQTLNFTKNAKESDEIGPKQPGEEEETGTIAHSSHQTLNLTENAKESDEIGPKQPEKEEETGTIASSSHQTLNLTENAKDSAEIGPKQLEEEEKTDTIAPSSHQTLNLNENAKERDEIRLKQPKEEETDTCAGRYVYMHNLPSIFNDDIIKNCRTLMKWFNMCPFMVNSGLGPQVLESDKATTRVLTPKTGSWYATNQFLLAVIFRERMKHYECLTNDSSLASAVYVPYYAGFDVGRYLWGYNVTVRDELAVKLARWLRERPEWNKMHGRDHFFVTGRIGWDFRRMFENDADWGSKLMTLPEISNMTMLAIETTAWTNEIAIPYPTYFHPKSLTEIQRWQRKVKKVKRRYLFSFVGGSRPQLDGSIRGEIINQCLASHGKCKFLDCKVSDCDNPVKIMEVFQESVFCLQPPGDSYTRRSIFDSILAGCIPVFFHPGSGYNQYIWYFPKNYTKFSVYIPEKEMKNGTVSLKKLLSRIDKERISRMRNEVVKIILKIIYTKPGLVGPEKVNDAFDIAVDKILERVAMVKRMMEEGKDLESEYSQTRDLQKLSENHIK